MAEPVLVESREIRPSVSVGIALSALAHQKPEDVLRDADIAMRRAKALGGSRSEVLDEAMHTRAEGRLRLESDLLSALSEHQFQHSLPTGSGTNTRTVSSFEALPTLGTSQTQGKRFPVAPVITAFGGAALPTIQDSTSSAIFGADRFRSAGNWQGMASRQRFRQFGAHHGERLGSAVLRRAPGE